ncbi:1-(5-phosphoribosyl)-5-[(5-phosphoribosylamino)methylideneamino]imidazole-4-carboxamide isomerase [Rhizosaccharibacter radicis]|uniref:1-(5-phosphoribosyl)-5-[(5-phosphoribosylamino)methylideneamino] imidazole-4-carboxamide isomerase n=1 Tax=Rhizosaccharibacter radicis TaxID=2782605 RepID=A0ABT1W3F5_9PROT|nr:1-(5-phosphoribosyl)-5-[(5-phosphoribosylamino)methylideneamino]imidazole-4-carboxamide isomerase [Acetobacteraceae bacterium KSS12]
MPSDAVSHPSLSAERVSALSDDDLQALCEATDAAILEGGGFGWLSSPGRQTLEKYFRGVLLVPERALFVARLDGTIVGAAQLVRPPRNNEAQAMSATLTHAYVAPYARGHGLARMMTEAVEERARALGYQVLNLDVRETQTAAISLYQRLGYTHWGTHPHYARVGGGTVRGLFFCKRLQDGPAHGADHAARPAHARDTTRTPAPRDPPHDAGRTPSARPGTGRQEKPLPPQRILTLYPAIDLKDGHCVRLRRGDMQDATVYSDDPGAQARAWAAAGCRWLHVVDLNGAFAGRSVNEEAIEAIIANAEVPVQLGGGLRDIGAIERWLSAGIRRVILGSAAVKNPALVREACRLFPGRIVCGIDARDGRVATEGWAEVSEVAAAELALRMEDVGVSAIIFTEITRDGMLQGLDVQQTCALSARLSTPVIASGGVGNVGHLEALRIAAANFPGIEGVIVGRALYDGRVDPQAAIQALGDVPAVLAPPRGG